METYVGRCYFCGVGEESQRGVVATNATGFSEGIQKIMRGEHTEIKYRCGVGKEDCSVVKLFELSNDIGRLRSSIDGKMII